jgi:TRAP-type C4-dicarboxylate transport system substrate-binding protein
MSSPRKSPAPPRSHRVSTVTAGIVLAAAVALTSSACSTEERDGGKDNPLQMADGWSLTHPFGVGGTTPFLDSLKESGVNVDYYSAGQMGKPQDLPYMLRNNTVDISIAAPSYNSSAFPLSSVGDLPGFGGDACTIGYAMTELGQPGNILYDEELKDMHFRPLWTSTMTSYEVMTAHRKVTTPQDAAGTILRSPGGSLDRVVNHLDAAGVSMPTDDFYEAISRSTVEGTVTSPLSVTPYGLQDVLTDSTVGAELGSISVYYGINTDTWDRLSTEQQDAVTRAADVAQQSVCTKLNEEKDAAYKTMADDGVTLHDVSGDAATWRRVTDPVQDEWVDTAEKAGLPARQTLKDFRAAMERNSHRSTDRHAGPNDPTTSGKE